MHNKYIKSYLKRLDRTYKDDFKIKPKKNVPDDMDLGLGPGGGKQSQEIPAKKYEKNIWEVPLVHLIKKKYSGY